MWRQLEVLNLKLSERPSTGLDVASDLCRSARIEPRRWNQQN